MDAGASLRAGERCLLGYHAPAAGPYPRVSFCFSRSFHTHRDFSPLRPCGPPAPTAVTIVLGRGAAEEGSRRPDLASGLSSRLAPPPPRAPEAPFADLCRERETAPERSRKAAEDAPERFRRLPTAHRLRKEPKGLPTLGLPSPSGKGRSCPSGRPAGLLEAAAAPCWMLCSLSEENPPASPEPRYREGRRFPRGGG